MNKNTLTKSKYIRYILTLFIIAAAIVAVFLSKNHLNRASEDTFKEKIDLNSKQYYMQYNKEYIYSMYNEKSVEKWKKLSLEEKRLRLEYIIKNQCVNLGMDYL